MKRQMQGVTLIDLLIAIALLAIFFSMISPVGDWIARQQMRSAYSEILMSINYARNLAISTGSPVTICALHGTYKCQNPWQGELTIFLDKSRKRAISESSEIRKIMKIPTSVQVQWRGMNPNHSIHFSPTGLTFVSNGTFTLTHPALDAPKKIIINRQGRARTK